MKKLRINVLLVALMALLSGGFASCGDDEPGGSSSSAKGALTIDGDAWKNPRIVVFKYANGMTYFEYLAADYTDGTRFFNFTADYYSFDEEDEGDDIAEDIEVRDLGKSYTTNYDTEYISGKVIVSRVTETSITLDFKNYQFYFYPSWNDSPTEEYRHKVNGKVKFTLDGM